MTNEPVAYRKRDDNEVLWLYDERRYPDFDIVEPLYTKEQLQPKVQMTSKEFDEWKELYHRLISLSLGVHRILNELLSSASTTQGKYTKLAKRVYQDDDFMSVSKKQAELINLFINYSPDKPEETIEIVKTKKWFVRSKDDYDGYYFYLLQNNDDPMLDYEKSKAPHTEYLNFDTKAEAELWTNPKTEAVYL